MENERIRRIYDRQGPRLGGPVDRALTGRLRKRALHGAHGRVLEIGIGSGASLPYYPPGVRITGVDLSPVSLEYARRLARELRLAATLVEGDAQALPFADDSFDTCVSQLTLCTIPDPLAALRELRRVCRPGGLVLLMEHTTSTCFLLAPLCRYVAPPLCRAVGCHPNRQVEDLVARAGLRLEASERRAAGILRLMRATP
jgi:ubiquinone/menaquinone biosynthesis C-methylase UbiE